MAPRTTTINQEAQKQSGIDINRLDTDLKGLEDRLSSIFNLRWKNDPLKAETEKLKVQEKLLANEKAHAKVQQALDSNFKKSQREAERKNKELIARLELATANNFGAQIKASAKLFGHSLLDVGKNLKDNFKQAIGKVNTGIETYASTIAKYSAGIEARLQTGASNDAKLFDNLLDKVKSNLNGNPFLKQEDMLSNLNELIQMGVNYNIEQRAFLQSMTDKIVTTFNAFDSNLLNLIKLQGADSTAARMGMEAALTKSFNDMFRDTSYLTNTFDSVSQALHETVATMDRDAGVEFEYVVQKWLGSLGSVGVSDSALTKLATAINYIGTGNVEALASDAAMQNLLTIASNRSGLNYSELLTNGLTASNTNILLRGIVDYVQEISETDNNVVKQQFGQLFGMSISDMVGALNLNTDQLSKVQQAMLSYEDAVAETEQQLSKVSDRMHISTMVENYFDNVMKSAAGDIANNAVSYTLWKTLDLVEGLTGGIQIPAISIMGNMVDLDTTVTALMKGGMAGISLIGNFLGSLNNLYNGSNMSLSAWGAEDSLTRGTGFGGAKSGYRLTQSKSAAIVSTSGDDMAEHAITAASEEGNEKISGAASEETATEKMLKAIMKAVIGSENPEDATVGVNVKLDNSLNSDTLNVRVINNDAFSGLYYNPSSKTANV